MQHRDASAQASKRAFLIAPMSKIGQELAPLFASYLANAAIVEVKAYPSPRDMATTLGSGASHLVFLDMVSDREQALQLLGEMTRLEPSIQVIALLAGNDPDLILRCLRGGAVDFLIHPFTGDQMEAALGKLARLQPSAEAAGKEPAKTF